MKLQDIDLEDPATLDLLDKLIKKNKKNKPKKTLKKPRIPASWKDGLILLDAVNNEHDRLILRLCLYQGLRVGEILGNKYSIRLDGTHLKPLKLKDVDLERKTIYIEGKGQSMGQVYLDPVTLELLDKWIKKYRIKKPEGQLFHITARTFENRVKALAISANVENCQRFGPHVLRAISITFYKKQTDLSSARYHARHKSIVTTAIYDRPTSDDRRDEEKKVFGDIEPRDPIDKDQDKAGK